MGFYIDPEIGYFAGDPRPGAEEVPERPTPEHEWDGAAWVESLPLVKARRIEEVRAEALDTVIEREIATAKAAVEAAATPTKVRAIKLGA